MNRRGFLRSFLGAPVAVIAPVALMTQTPVAENSAQLVLRLSAKMAKYERDMDSVLASRDWYSGLTGERGPELLIPNTRNVTPNSISEIVSQSRRDADKYADQIDKLIAHGNKTLGKVVT